ncbi:MAG: hypothetical protein Q8R98_10795 [Rubrivivax sp.]|nr:hypothetical protein [Rubrivivax sp.]
MILSSNTLADDPAHRGPASTTAWATTTAAAALSLILLILGVGLGLSSVSPWAPRDTAQADTARRSSF